MTDLTTLTAVKAWLNVASNNDDALLSSLISQVSGVILSYLSRPDILRRQYTEQFTSSQQSSRMLRNYPVIAVSSVSNGYQSIPAGDGIRSGYWVEPDDGIPPGRLQCLTMVGQTFGPQPTKIIYEAGYLIANEAQTASTAVTAMAPNGSWARDEGVTYADGRTMTKVPSNPIEGQYALNAKVPGQYGFAAADTGAPVLLNYSYIPSVLEQACIETVAERYRYRDRIGQASKNISGEVVSFSLKDMQDYVKSALQPYRRLVPV